MNDFIYYLNGKFLPASETALPIGDLGVVRGYGVFDLWRTYAAIPFRQRQHLERLQRSAAQIDLSLPWSLDELEAIASETLARNNHPHDVTVRMVVTGGESANFITPEEKPSLAVMIAPVKAQPAHFYSEGSKLITLEMDRFMPTVKSLNYISAIMAQKKARAAGAIEALYRDTAGTISECTVSNLFLFQGEQMITPAVGVLAGITRAVALELAEDRFEVVERAVYLDEVLAADEVFITSTTKEIMPVVQIDEVRIANGKPGERTRYLGKLFKEQIARS